MKDKLYTVTELTEILKLHSKTIVRFIHEGKIKAQKIGRSWMVSETDLKNYVHGELLTPVNIQETTNYPTLKKRITVSAVFEIEEQNSEEATRISNSLMAMLNSRSGSEGKTRFDFFYYPELQKAKYVVYGTTKTIMEIIRIFEILSAQKED